MQLLLLNPSSTPPYNLSPLNDKIMRLGQGKQVENVEDLIYHIYYTDFQPDKIILGDNIILPNNLETFFKNSNESFKQKINKITESKISHFECLALGKICQEICNEQNKKDPDIIIITYHCLDKWHKEKFKEAKIKLIDTHENFGRSFGSVIEKIINS